MAFGITLTLDEELEAQVRRVWHELEVVGVGTSPATFGEPPHVTLALIPSAAPEYLASLVDRLTFSGLSLQLVPLGVFLGELHTLYFAAALSPGLLAAHAQLCGLLHADGVGVDPLYAPGSVVFHCALAVDVEPRSLPRGIAVCGGFPDTLVGSARAVKLFEYFPVRLVHSRGLSGGRSR